MAKLTFNKLKITEAIWLPQIAEHWELVKVRHLFKESTKKGFPNETLLVASQEHGVVSKDAYGKRTVEATKDLQNLKLVEKGDFVISLRSFQGGIEVAHERGIISPAYTVLKETRQIEKRYFKNLFKSPPFISLMTLCVKGIREGQNIDYPTFKNEYLPLPPLEEQQAIAAYLDKKNSEIDKFIRNKEKLIDLLEEEKKSIIINSVSKGIANVELADFGNDWLGSLPKHWQIKRNKLLFRKTKNIIGNKSSKYKILSLSVNGVIERDIESNFGKMPTTFNDYQVIYPDTLLMCLFDIDVTPRGIGYVGQVGITSAAYTNLIKVDKGINLEYYYYWFLSLDFNKRLLEFATNLRNTVLMDVFGALYSPYPPIVEQQQIVEYIKIEVAKLEAAIKNAKLEISSIKEYRQALITDLVTGKRSVPQLQMS